MPKNNDSILEASEEDMDIIDKTPVANHLFTVREYGYSLTGMQADLFWTLVEEILFVSFWS